MKKANPQQTKTSKLLRNRSGSTKPKQPGPLLPFAFYILSFALTSCSPQQKAPPPPNLIFILADDLGWAQLGCYGGEAYKTPHIDKLASEGMHFTQAYASAAVCSPTRAALMTGKYPARLHLTDFIKGEAFPDSLLEQPDWQKFLPLEETTIAEAFKAQGYRTAHFGKWHLSQEKRPPESLPYNPGKQGFDEVLVTYKPVKGKTDPEKDPHNVDTITQRAIEFLEQQNEKPFFLYVSHNSIHDPVMENEARIEKFKGRPELEKNDVWPVLAAMVNRLDDGVGRLLEKVEELGLKGNTIVVFYSDNGGKETYAEQGPLRRGKGWLYEGGIRVPLIIRWPGRIAAGISSEQVLSSIDLFPTLQELCGLPAPQEPIDGRSFAGQILGEAPTTSRVQYWHYPHYHRGSGMKPAGAIRRDNYKLLEWYEPLLAGEEGAIELYDLDHDISEQYNLADSIPEVAAELQQSLAEWREQIGAQMPTLRVNKNSKEK